MKENKITLNLNEVGINDIDVAGGKNASLGEMMRNLSHLGIKIPNGFLVTVAGYNDFIAFNNLESVIAKIISDTNVDDLKALSNCGSLIREKIRSANFPTYFTNQVRDAYSALSAQYQQKNVAVAVRSSATAEDLPDASFAGQQETFLNVSGDEDLFLAIKNCFASLFTDRAISYRKSFGYNHFKIGLSVCIQKMVRSDIGASGVAFSLDTESGFKDVVVINGTFGLGEMVVQGAVSPDEFITYKPLLKEQFPAILEKKLGNKDKKMVYSTAKNERVKIVATSALEAKSFCLTDAQILKLSYWVIAIEDYYTSLKNHWCPMDVEWALDGKSNELYIVQARPETIHSQKIHNKIVSYKIADAENAKTRLKGVAVGDKIGAGKVKIVPALVKNLSEINFEPGSILVTEMTDPDWEPIMKIASAIITEKGGRTCHAAIIARELGIPAIVACENATQLLKDDDLVTVSCAEGEVGFIYQGILKVEKTEVLLDKLPKVNTPLLLNVASPDKAFHFANLPHQGIGLVRMEFIINNYIKVHPLALLNHSSLKEQNLKSKITETIKGYENGEAYFVEKLSFGLAKIAASCYPKPAIVRFSDFKSNEYANLLGGTLFEPNEENPMIGWRGASRYYSEAYKDAFGLECKAIKHVRENLGLTNIIVMIPFCRTVEELKRVYSVMEANGLKRGRNGLQVYLMAELPSNFIMAKEFANYVDGFSIGSNDLTQLVLGLDRDSAQVSHLYDERNSAVKKLISMLISSVKDKNVKVGICGQGPSDFPDFAQFLVEKGINTISITPDAFFKTAHAIVESEHIIAKKKLRAKQRVKMYRVS
ncbi:phosphoenolpyruvate synthase [Pedobacter arcticus]|uniref:phosphoenolpyruvate synthase n=1 Tax=Pedobacter arcticus TaxID=752140 RepID=UPI0002E0A0FA|nr:phosphoenolpyruvate synthase [Pedobacter arcticus]